MLIPRMASLSKTAGLNIFFHIRDVVTPGVADLPLPRGKTFVRHAGPTSGVADRPPGVRGAKMRGEVRW